MCVSRLCFHAIPGRTGEVEKALRSSRRWWQVPPLNPDPEHSLRVAGRAPDIVFEQELEDLAGFEAQLRKLPITKPFNPTRQ
jgi:hypothetical protein